MAHYALLDENRVVTEVFVGRNEDDPPGNWEDYYGAKRTSYNTRGGVYFCSDGVTPYQDQSKAFRKNFAGIGFTYDEQRDAFIPPKLFESWILNESTCCWEAPVPMPQDGRFYMWNEENLSWIAPNLSPTN